MEQKAKTFFYGILAVFAFSLVLGACPTNSGTPPDTSTLKLSGQVYIQNTDPFALLFNNSQNEKYTGNLNISDVGLGGTGQIKNGLLNYTIGIPPDLLPIGEGGGLDYLKDMYPGLEFSSEDVKATAVAFETNSEEYSNLFKYSLKIDLNFLKMTIKITIKSINYVYVDDDLNITADAHTFDYDEYLDFPISLTTDKINLSLKKGWNSLYSEITAESNIPPELILIINNPIPPDPDSPWPDLSNLRPKGTLKMSLGDPGNLNWILIPSQDDIIPQYPEYPDFE